MTVFYRKSYILVGVFPSSPSSVIPPHGVGRRWRWWRWCFSGPACGRLNLSLLIWHRSHILYAGVRVHKGGAGVPVLWGICRRTDLPDLPHTSTSSSPPPHTLTSSHRFDLWPMTAGAPGLHVPSASPYWFLAMNLTLGASGDHRDNNERDIVPSLRDKFPNQTIALHFPLFTLFIKTSHLSWAVLVLFQQLIHEWEVRGSACISCPWEKTRPIYSD